MIAKAKGVNAMACIVRLSVTNDSQNASVRLGIPCGREVSVI